MVFTHSYSSSFIGDNFGGCVDADGVETVNQVHSIVERDFVKVNDVFEIPTDDATAMLHAGEGDMQGIGGPFLRDDARPQVAVAQADGFDGDVDKLGPGQVLFINFANALWRIFQFIDNDGRDDQLKTSGFDLGEELRGRPVDSRIEYPAIDGGVGINANGHGG